MARGYSIPEEDLPLITELLQTLTMQIVAGKWDIGRDALARNLKHYGLSHMKIRYTYLKDQYLIEKAKGKNHTAIAKKLGVTRTTLSRAVNKELK